MANILKITFLSPAQPDDRLFFKWTTDFGADFFVSERFKEVRLYPGETTIGSDANSQALNYYNAFLQDYNSANLWIVTINENVVTIRATNNSVFFDYGIESEIEFATFEFIPDSTVSGLSGNNYYINNDIYVHLSISELNAIPVNYEVKITNAETQQNETVKIYPKADGSVMFNLSPALKSLFKKPEHNTSYQLEELTDNACRNVFNFLFISRYTISDVPFEDITTLTGKVFLRGGFIGNNSNIILSLGTVLNSSEIMPYWSGYPVAEYKLLSSGISKNTFLDSIENKELRYFKGCNPTYLKFLNSKGGYSYWLFEGLTDNKGTSNLGYSNNFGKVTDFGNTVNPSIQLYSKVPARFYPLMLDLIESPEIYIYKSSNEWERIINNNNSLSRNEAKKSYEVKLNFERISNYKPSLLW